MILNTLLCNIFWLTHEFQFEQMFTQRCQHFPPSLHLRLDTWTVHVCFGLTLWTLTCELWANRKLSDVCVPRNKSFGILWFFSPFFSCQEFVVSEVGTSVQNTLLYSNIIPTGCSCIQLKSIKMHFLTLIRTWCFIHVHWKLGHLPSWKFLLSITGPSS